MKPDLQGPAELAEPAHSDRDKHVLLQQPERRVRPSLGPLVAVSTEALGSLQDWSLQTTDQLEDLPHFSAASQNPIVLGGEERGDPRSAQRQYRLINCLSWHDYTPECSPRSLEAVF